MSQSSNKIILRSEIVGGGAPATVRRVDAFTERPGISGLVTLTQRLVERQAQVVPLANDEYGVAMNQNVGFGGTPLLIHDGEDSVAWTATNIIGTDMDPNSNNRAQAGTQSIRVNSPNLSDVWEIDKGSSQALSSYTTISMFINVNRRWTNGDSVELYGWDGSSEVGIRVKLEDYLDFLEYDVWHSVIIPLTDMDLAGETITGLRMQLVGTQGPTPDFFIDELYLQETGAAILFKAGAPTHTRYHVTKFIITIVDNIASTLADGTMPALSYDDILGVSTLTNGIVLSHVVGGVPIFQIPFNSIADFFALGFDLKTCISDGTNTLIVLEMTFQEPLVIHGNNDNNYVAITVQDNLSPLVRFTAALRGAIDIGLKN